MLLAAVDIQASRSCAYVSASPLAKAPTTRDRWSGETSEIETAMHFWEGEKYFVKNSGDLRNRFSDLRNRLPEQLAADSRKTGRI